MNRRSRISAKKAQRPDYEVIRGEPLRPVRVVERVLVSPDGSSLKVRVPVYPPFELKRRPAAKSTRSRKARRSW